MSDSSSTAISTVISTVSGTEGGFLGWDCTPAPSPALLQNDGSIAEALLHGYLCFSYVPSPPKPFPLTPSESPGGTDQLLSHLRNAIERRLTATDTIGVYLSGGLDSSLVASLLVEAGVKPHLFTLDFGEPFHLELPIAEQVAKHLHLPLRTVSARPSDIAKALEKTVQALPLPFGDAVTVPLYLLGQTARDFVSEVWNGEGGDQLFGGWTNKPMIAAHLYDLAEDTESVQQSEVQEYLATYHRFWGQTPSLYTPYQQQKTQDIDPSQWITPALDRERFPHLLHRLRYANLLLKGAQNIAPRMLALAHCHGLKVCSPLFDANLTEWTFSLPPEMFLSGACEKFLLKQIAERYLPTEVVWREKRGMGVPVTSWCLSRWSPSHWTFQRLLRYYLSNRRLHHEGRFEPAFVQRLLQGEDSTPEGSFRKRRVGEKLWLLLIWEIWREQHGVA